MPTISLLDTVADKTQSTVLIKLCNTLGGSYILPLFLREAADLIEKGWAQDSLMGSNDSMVIFAEVDNEIAGFIVFNFQKDFRKTTWIVLGSVVEKFKRRGIYQLMHKSLEKIATFHKSEQIQSNVHIENLAMIEASKAIGSAPLFYKVIMDLKDKE